MIIPSFFLALTGWTRPVPLQTEPLTPGPKLVSKMLDKYHSAKTLTASIHMVQSAMNKQLSFDTALAYERPQKIYLVQKRSDDSNYLRQLISDSVQFEYTAPQNLDNKRVGLLKETTHPKAGQLNIDEMWGTLKPELDKGDDSLALACLISRLRDLQTEIGQLSTCVNKGRVQLGGRLVNDIEGVWKATGYGQTGTYQLYITDDGDLVRHVVNMAFGVSAQWLINHKMAPNAFPDGIMTTTVWDITASVDQPVSANTFRLQ